MSYDQSWPLICSVIIGENYKPRASAYAEFGKAFFANQNIREGYRLGQGTQQVDPDVAAFFYDILVTNRCRITYGLAQTFDEFAPANELISANSGADNDEVSFLQAELEFMLSQVSGYSDELKNDRVLRGLLAGYELAVYPDAHDNTPTLLDNSLLQVSATALGSFEQVREHPLVAFTCAAAWLADYEGTFRDAVAECYGKYTTGTTKTEAGTARTGKSGGCYIATAVYGSYDCPQVWTLRRYRDERLLPTSFGRAFVRAYYATSPTLVKLFGGSTAFKRICRRLLDPFVAKLNAQGFEATPYKDVRAK